MNPFEKLFGQKKEAEMPTTEQEQVADTSEDGQIKNSHDFMQAIYAGRLAEAEAYLVAEKNNPSQSGHDDLWLINKLSILLSQYLDKKDTLGVERINQLLPESHQRHLEENI